MPKLFREDNQDQWFVIKSKQITRFIRTHPKESSWLVEDHFHPIKGISYSLHTNFKKANETYSLISFQGTNYYATSSDGNWLSDQVDCQLDYRQDSRTLFPWKYTNAIKLIDDEMTKNKTTLEDTKLEISKTILGFGAVWLNLIDKKVKCSLSEIDEQILTCNLKDELGKQFVKINFKWPIETSNGLVMPKSAHLSRTQTIHLDGLKLVQYVTIDVLDILVTNFQAMNMEKRIENLLKLCKTSMAKKEVQFPSLIKSIDSTYQQNYYLYYSVKLYATSTGAGQLERNSTQVPDVQQSFNYQEWFSNKDEVQTIVRRDTKNEFDEGGEKFYSLFKYRMPKAKNNLNYKAKFYKEENHQVPVKCQLLNDDDDNELCKLFSISHLFTREIRFTLVPDNDKEPHLNRKKYNQHSGYLIGLGALLMNAVDIQSKRLAPTISRTNRPILNNKWHSHLEWTIEDPESAYNFHFFFRSHSMEEHKLEIDDLMKIEIRQMVEKTTMTQKETSDDQKCSNKSVFDLKDGLDEEEQLKSEAYFNLLIMSIDLIDFSTSLWQDQILEAFILPEICNFDVAKVVENVDNDGDINDKQDQNITDQKENIDEENYEPEFPSFEEYLQFSRDYVIHSEWNFDDGTYLKVAEYFMIVDDSNEGENKDKLLARLDITRATNELEIMEEYSIYLRYSGKIMIKYEDGKCRRLDRLDDWLEAFSTCRVDADYDMKSWDFTGATLKFYGLGALWRLASVIRPEYLGRFSGKNDPDQLGQKSKFDYELWRRESSDSEVSMLLKFYLLNSTQLEVDKRVRLAWIQVDTSKVDDVTTFKTVNTIRIENVQIEANSVSKLYFMLPSVCDSISDKAEQEMLEDQPQFPAFSMAFNATPKLADFELRYNLIMGYNGISYQGAVIESRGLLSISIGGQKWRIWMLGDGGEGGIKNLLEQVSSNRCKSIQELTSFFNLNDFINIIVANFDHLKQNNYLDSLLANLWNLLSLRVEQEQISSKETGSRLKVIAHAKFDHEHVNSRRKLIEWSIWDNSKQISISITFEQIQTNNSRLILHSLVLSSPKYTLRFMNQYSPRKSGLNDINVPATCSRQLENNVSTMFPSLSSHFSGHGKQFTNEAIHLRSEVISLSPFENGNLLLLLDEWFRPSDQSYRSNSRGLARATKFQDFLIYGATKEFFDLSTKFKCSTPEYDANVGSTKTTQSVTVESVDNFIVRELLIGVGINGGAFYHPLALWFFAEQAEVKRNLIKASQLNLRDLFNSSKLIDWFSIEQWHIQHKELKNLRYTLTFNTDFDGQKHRIVLNRLETFDWRRDIVVEVVNYKYLHHHDQENLIDSDSMEPFLIPKGRGCRRNDLAKRKYLKDQLDVLVLERLNPIQFDYMASLETLEDGLIAASLSPRPVFHSGWFGKCPPSWTLEPVCELKVNHERKHYLNGTIKSQRHVISGEHNDPFISQVRSLDEISGHCSVRAQRKSSQNHLLNLDFNVDGFAEMDSILVRDLPLFDVITMRLPEYELIQWHENSDSSIKLVYELRMSNFSLNKQLTGETSLIRTLERGANLKPVGNFFYHSEAKLEVLIENKAKFMLNIENLGYRECLSTLLRSRTIDCHQSSEFLQYDSMQDELESHHQKLRNFHLIYFPIDNGLNEDINVAPKKYEQMNRDLFDIFKSTIERSFVESLLKLPLDLSATQLGETQVNYRDEDKTIHVLFDLMEPPSALEYFEEIKKMRMRPSSLLFSAIKLLNSKYTCSRWCDIENCNAFSYCSFDKSCQILVLNLDSDLGAKKYDIGELNSSIDLAEDNTCSYYKAPLYLPRGNLNKAIGFMKENAIQIAEQNDFKRVRINQLEIMLNLPSSKSQIQFVARELNEITSFTEAISKKKAELQRETYTILKDRFQISAFSLGKQQKMGQILVMYHLIQVNNLANCFSECSTIDCQLLSYCNSAQTCILMHNLTSPRDFQDIITENLEQNNDCSVFVRDFLVEYQRFSDTKLPKSWKGSFNNISLLECASLCQFETSKQAEATFDCLSFDYCSIETTDDSQPTVTKSSSTTTTTTCFIQDMHIIMNDFDKRIVSASENGVEKRADSTGPYCSHYSKSLLADFSHYSDKRFSKHDSIVFNGIDLEKCTLICRRDEECLAFEYCASKSSCFILRNQEETSFEQDFDSAFSQIIDDSIPSEKCAIFRLKHFEEKFRIYSNVSEEITIESYFQSYEQQAADSTSLICDIFILLGLSLISITFGTILQVSLIIITGRKLQFRPPFLTPPANN